MKKTIRFCLTLIFLFAMCRNRPTQYTFYQVAPKYAEKPEYVETGLSRDVPTVHITVHCRDTLAGVSPLIYGANANVYMTQMVDNPKLIRFIRQLSPNIIRYPGGNLSSLFFWDHAPDTPPEGAPDTLYGGLEKRYSEQYWYGRNDKAGTLSLDNYYKMLEMTNSTGIITVNYSYARYGTSQDPVAAAAGYAADWVRYDNGRTRFWEIGNENYGAWQAGYRIEPTQNRDGQPEIITGALYGRQFKILADSMRDAAREVGTEIQLGAVLLEETREWHTPVQQDWNSGFFREAGNAADFFVVHSYYTPYEENSSVETILNSAEPVTSEIIHFIRQVADQHGVAMKPLALTEWNIFAAGSMQQVSYVNGMHAVLVLGELIKNRYGMANRWNLANAWANGNDHGMFSRAGEPDVPLFNPRPSFHYLTLFQRFFGDHMVASSCVQDDSNVVAYGSTFHSGEAGIVLINKGRTDHTILLELKDFKIGDRCYWYTLTGGEDNGDFSRKVYVNGAGPDLPAGGPDLDDVKAFSAVIDGNIQIDLPGLGVVYLLVESSVR